MSSPPEGVPAGWYPDGRGAQRWWDGSAWTDATAAIPPSAPPGPTASASAEPAAGRTAPRGRGARVLVIAVVALAVVGVGAVLVRARLTGDPQPNLAVYLDPAAPAGTEARIRQEVIGDQQVQSARFVSKPAAFAEFTCIFAKDPSMVASVTPDILPPSLRLYVPGGDDALQSAVARYTKMPGVKNVVRADAPFEGPGAVREDALRCALDRGDKVK